ncbi:MAG: DsrE family protein [Desulfobacteraceae bacterium]|nr:DsrE family protein [Desulfobacteraceae bacterium]
MTTDILILVRKGPYSGFQAAEALRHANGSLSLGFRPVVVLMDDGVYLAKEDQTPGQSQWLALGETFEEIIARGLYENKEAPAEFYVEEASLRQRGLELDDLIESLEPVDSGKLAELMHRYPLQLIF